MLRSLIVAALLYCGAASPAVAQVDFGFMLQGPWNAHAQRSMRAHGARAPRASYGKVIAGRPAGCPRAYCGCASARKVGISGARWNVNLASAWYGLPRAAPASGMACVTPHHVKIILGSAGGGRYQSYDPNSGGGQTRITTGPLNCTVVNPHGAYRGGYTAKRKRGRR